MFGCTREASGGARRNRTDGLMLAKHALYQLSYGPRAGGRRAEMVGLGRLELPTSRLSSARSNQLSYKPKTCSSHMENTMRRKSFRMRPLARPGRKRDEDGGFPQ